MVIALVTFGVLPVLLALVPTVAIYPILLYIAMLIGSQAFQETPRAHAPAIILSFVPHLAHWAATLVGGALTAVGTILPALTPAQYAKVIADMRNEGVLFDGLSVLGGGSILGGLVFGAVAAFIIDRKFSKAAAFAAAGGVMTLFGFMHGDKIGIAHGLSLTVAFSYFAAAGVLLACGRMPAAEAFVPRAHDEGHYEAEPEGAGHLIEGDLAAVAK
jgi:AGZA family xanthine/uracil permease-like MFS transporter